MDILRLMLEHDIHSTRYQLQIASGLSQSVLHQEFDFGQGSLYNTFDHFIDSKEFWTYLMQGHTEQYTAPTPPDPARRTESLIRRFEENAGEFVDIATKIWNDGRLGNTFLDKETGPARRSYGACIYHVLSHSTHHRAQIFVMFDLLKIPYNPYAGSAIDSHPLTAED